MLPSFSEWLYFIFSLFLLQIGRLIKGEKTHFGLAKAIKNSIFDSKYSEYLNKNVYMQFEKSFLWQLYFQISLSLDIKI